MAKAGYDYTPPSPDPTLDLSGAIGFNLLMLPKKVAMPAGSQGLPGVCARVCRNGNASANAFRVCGAAVPFEER